MSCRQFPEVPDSRITRSMMISRGRRDPRQPLASWVRDRREAERLGDGVRCGDFPFGKCGGVFSPPAAFPSPPDIPTLSDSSDDQPRPLGEVMAALVPSQLALMPIISALDGDRRRELGNTA